MNSAGFAYFRWCSTKFRTIPPDAFGNQVRLSIWRDLQQGAFHRKMAKPKDKRA